jgi:hypothetical protein
MHKILAHVSPVHPLAWVTGSKVDKECLEGSGTPTVHVTCYLNFHILHFIPSPEGFCPC